MKVLEAKAKIALKSVLFATDFEVLANRALPFAVALANRYGGTLFAAHVIPHEAYAFARPESIDRILKEVRDHAAYSLHQVTGPLKHRGTRCEPLLTEGNVAEKLVEFVQRYDIDLIVLGTSGRAGLGKLFLGSVAEEIIREAPCPVLTVGPHVVTDPGAGIQSIVCAIDFSPGSLRAAEVAASLAHEYKAHLTLMHVVEGILTEAPHLAMRVNENRLKAVLPFALALQYEPQVMVEMGPVAQRIFSVGTDLSADLIAMGARGAGAFAQTASHFGSIAHKVISLATCPVLTVGGTLETENDT